jgi:hypothetical protein
LVWRDPPERGSHVAAEEDVPISDRQKIATSAFGSPTSFAGS